MKLLPINKNYIALSIAFMIAIGFFLSGLLEILDYFIVKVLLFTSFGALLFYAVGFALKNEAKKNHPKEQLQDDSY